MMSKVVLVTGAAKRVGHSISFFLAQKGYDIAIHYNHSKDDAQNLADNIISLGRKAEIFQAELTDPKSAESLFDKVIEKFDAIDVIINNASLFENDILENVTYDLWQKHINIHCWTPTIFAQKILKQNKIGSSIINIIDQRIEQLNPNFYSYTASKALLATLTKTMAMSLAPYVRANAIAPGATLPSKRQTQADFDKQQLLTPLNTGTKIQDILNAVEFILNTQSLTGQLITIDGGQHLDWRTPNFLQIEE